MPNASDDEIRRGLNEYGDALRKLNQATVATSLGTPAASETFAPDKLQANLATIENNRQLIVLDTPEGPKYVPWEAITPLEIRVAIGSIHKELKMALGLYRMEIGNNCRNALQSFVPAAALLLPFFKAPRTMDELTKYREQKIEPEAATTLSEIFKAYSDKYIHRVWELMRDGFTSFLRIARTQQHLIQTSPIDWAHAHVSILLCGEQRQLKRLIKDMCDTQEQYDQSTDFEEWIFWRAWRAPLLVHMCPMGNSLYDHSHAWDREDQGKTEETLDAVSKHIIMAVVFSIKKIVERLHVQEAASTPFNPQATPNTVTKAMSTATSTQYSFRELEQKFNECRVGKPGRGFPHAWVLSDGSTQISALDTRIEDYCALAGRAMGYAGDDPQGYWVRHVAAQRGVKTNKFTTTAPDAGIHEDLVIEDLSEASAHVCRLLMVQEVRESGGIPVSVRTLSSQRQEGSMTPEEARPEIAREFDVFISHATEDKSYVEPLAKALESAGIRVWFDSTALEWGDDLRSAIDRGLTNCRYGIVVFSQAFLRKKKWTEYELNALFAREKAGEKLILPIWHNISRDDLISYGPAFADRVAKISATDSYFDIVKSLLVMLGRSSPYESGAKGVSASDQAGQRKQKLNAIAYARYETSGENAVTAESYVRPSAEKEGWFTFENSLGEEQHGTREEIAMRFAMFDKSLTIKGYIRKQYGNSGDRVFNL